MKVIKRGIMFLLAIVMVLGAPITAMAEESSIDVTEEDAEGGYDITEEVEASLKATAINTSTDNDALIAIAAQNVLDAEVVTYTSSNQISCLVQLGYSCNGTDGPISITKGTYTYKKYWWTETTDVYLVCLSGTDTDAENTTTDYWTDLLSGFEFDNKYVQNVKKAIQENIPSNSNIILAGHSLGGMVCQQVAAESELKSNYNILNTVTFGSPLIDGFAREGIVKRLGDTSDIVPYLSVSTIYNIFWQAAGLNTESGGYGWDVLSAHCKSYNRNDVWGAYDVVGVKNGGATLSLDFSTTKFYASPVIVIE